MHNYTIQINDRLHTDNGDVCQNECSHLYFYIKGKGFSCQQALKGPWGSGRSRLRIYVTFGTMKVVRLSHLRTGRVYPQEFLYIMVLIFRG